MPAKFVNLIQFFEMKIFLEMKVIWFIERGFDCYRVVNRFNCCYVRPDIEFAAGQRWNCNPSMMNRYIFTVNDIFLAVKKINVYGAKPEVKTSHYPFLLKK